MQDGQRFANFVATVRNIIANNKDTKTTHWSGLNAYSALSDKEFRARFSTTLKREDTPVKASRPARRSLLQTLPAYKNWVAEGKVTSVKNQGGVSRPRMLVARRSRSCAVLCFPPWQHVAASGVCQQCPGSHLLPAGLAGGWWDRHP